MKYRSDSQMAQDTLTIKIAKATNPPFKKPTPVRQPLREITNEAPATINHPSVTPIASTTLKRKSAQDQSGTDVQSLPILDWRTESANKRFRSLLKESSIDMEQLPDAYDTSLTCFNLNLRVPTPMMMETASLSLKDPCG
ncbi:hypothetical protein LTR22_026798 [Elasticomyces elasticus]|nr:hypothetical protein LTR22_026798 [Elasticomyces elasticus]